MTTLAVKKSTEPETLYDRDYYAWRRCSTTTTGLTG